MRHLDLFSGIGGFALAARRVGWETVGFCEIDHYCQKVLAKHWPGVPIYDDVTKYTGTAGAADIITGGFPCQDISVAGRGAGIEGSRSGLWSDLCRIIGEVRPRYAVMENVSALLARGLERVLGDMAEIGYDCEWHCIPASVVGAPHQRDRIWIVAYPTQPRELEYKKRADESQKSMETTTAKTWGQRVQGIIKKSLQEQHSFSWCKDFGGIEELQGRSDIPEPILWRINDGVSFGVDRLRGLGNAIVPQVAEAIFRAINEIESNGVRYE